MFFVYSEDMKFKETGRDVPGICFLLDVVKEGKNSESGLYPVKKQEERNTLSHFTDVSLDEEEIIRIYGKVDIEYLKVWQSILI